MTDGSIKRRALAQRLSSAANQSVAQALSREIAEGSVAHRIAMTGPPGAGKSTLTGVLARERLGRPGTIGILAIDPTSPVSGGAILGDRIRMEALANEARIYIRSVASRSASGGLTDNLPDLLDVFDSEGFADVFVETVGVGQAEYEVRHFVDTTVLVLLPGAGDQIQMMKSGVIEAADIFAVNKSDLAGSERLAADLRSVLKLRGPAPGRWTPPVVAVSATTGSGIADLSAAIDAHSHWQENASNAEERRAARRAGHVRILVERRLGEILGPMPPESMRRPLSEIYADIVARLAID
ncbi:MAG: hypothetical protein ING19_13480 [Azospirillum sp.]|nr:hypothetical protein [Azospirillum sp.]